MQDEVNEKTVALYIKTGKLTAEVLQKAMKAALAQSKKQIGRQPHGKQTLSGEEEPNDNPDDGDDDEKVDNVDGENPSEDQTGGSDGTVITGNLDFSDPDNIPEGVGYKWENNILTLNGVTIKGTVTLPGGVIIKTVGASSIQTLAFSNSDATQVTFSGAGELTIQERINGGVNNESLTVDQGAKVIVKGGIGLGQSGGTDGTVTVNGTLTAGDGSGNAIYTGKVLIGSSGSLTVNCPIQVNGMNINGGRNFNGAFTIQPGGSFSTDYEGNVITVAYEAEGISFTDDDVKSIIVIPVGYLPDNHKPAVSEDGKSIIIVGGPGFAIKDNAPSLPGPSGGYYPSTPIVPTTYPVRTDPSGNGTVTVDPKNASQGKTVTVTVVPDEGYTLGSLIVTDSKGNPVALTDQGGGKYTFTMPGLGVTAKGVFVPEKPKTCDGGPDCPSRNFTDVGGVGTWRHEAVDFALRNGLMSGYSDTLFGPDDNLSRAQFAQILHNRVGNPAVTGGGFADVASVKWYAPAIAWAAANGIVTGCGGGRFGPNDSITREQLAVMLWRYAGTPAATEKELRFADADQASGWALEALCWATENGVISGKGNGALDPRGNATRAEAAQMLKNFMEKQ